MSFMLKILTGVRNSNFLNLLAVHQVLPRIVVIFGENGLHPNRYYLNHPLDGFLDSTFQTISRESRLILSSYFWKHQ